jgi:hypothetical protein
MVDIRLFTVGCVFRNRTANLGFQAVEEIND